MIKTLCAKRRDELLDRIEEMALDAFLVTDRTNISYLSGFKGHDATLIATKGRGFFITDSRYIEEARQDVSGFEVRLAGRSTYQAILDIIKKNRLKRIGFESMNLPYEVAARLKNIARPARLVGVRDMVERIRAVKDAFEIGLIRKSIAITGSVVDKVAGIIKPGVTEEFLSKRIDAEFLARGAVPAFDTIVSSGHNTSKPHARPTRLKIRKNDFVMMDVGCNLNGYNSDMTRMAVTGKVISRFKKIYDIVRSAQERAIAAIRPGASSGAVDAAARDHIEHSGFEKYFGHSVGHGVGMGVHELPTISKGSGTVLGPGMVFTVEPAIYIPGFGGVRIEDMVLVTKKGCEILTR